MKDVYRIDLSNLNSIKERIMKEHNSFSDKIKNNLSSGYLNNCSDASVTSMKNKINKYCSIIEKGYSSIESWLEDYINDASNIEKGITSGKYNIKDRDVSSLMSSLLKYKEVEIESSPDIENLLKRSSIKQNYPLYINGNYNPADNYEKLPFITGPNEKQNKVELYGANQMVYRPGINKNEIDDMVYRKGKEHATLELYSDEMEKPEYDERGFEINKTEEIDLEAIKEENQALLDSIEPIRIDLESQLEEAIAEEEEWLNENKHAGLSVDEVLEKRTELSKKRMELAESLSTILMFEQQVQNNLDLIPYMEIEMSDDYKKFVSEYEASKEYIGQDALKTGVNRWDYLADYEKNGAGGYVFKLREGEFETEIKVEDFSKYATEEEKNMYHYLCQTQSMEKANEYLLKKVDQINMMKGAELANYDLSEIKTTIAEEENADSAIEAAWAGLSNSFQAWGMGLLDGTENFATGFAKWFSKDKHMSAEQYSKIIVAQYLTEHKYGTHYEVGTVTGNLLPAIAVSIVSRSAALGMALPAEVAATYGEFAGVVSMGLSAGGNAKEYAMQHLGATESSALLYGLLIGTSEAVLGRYLGKIPGLSAEAGLSIKSLLMEGLEEWSQDWIAAGIQAVMYGKEIDFEELNEESMKSFLMGVLMAGAMNGASAVVQMKIDGQDIEINTNDIIGYLKENIAGNNNNSAVHSKRGSINLNAFKELFKSKGKKVIESPTISSFEINEESINNFKEIESIIFKDFRYVAGFNEIMRNTPEKAAKILSDQYGGSVELYLSYINYYNQIIDSIDQRLKSLHYSESEISIIKLGADAVTLNKILNSPKDGKIVEGLYKKVKAELNGLNYWRDGIKAVFDYELYQKNINDLNNSINSSSGKQMNSLIYLRDNANIVYMDSESYYFEYNGKTIIYPKKMKFGYNVQEYLDGINLIEKEHPELSGKFNKISFSSKKLNSEKRAAMATDACDGGDNLFIYPISKAFSKNELVACIVHEGTHSVDYNYMYSSSKDYHDAAMLDGNFTTSYGEDYFKENKGSLVEDFAEVGYVLELYGRTNFEKKFPNRANFFKKYLPNYYYSFKE